MSELDTSAPAVDSDVAPSTDLEAGAAEEPSAAVEPATPAWGPEALETPEFRYAVDQAARDYLAQQQGQWEQPQYQQGPEAPRPPEPFSDNYEAEMDAYLEYRDQRLIEAIQGTLAPVTESYEQSQIQQGTAQSMSTFATYTDLGEFDHQEAFNRAQGVFADLVGRYGPQYANEMAPRALRDAAVRQAAYEKQIGDRAVARWQQSMQDATNRGAAEPGVAGTGARTDGEAHSYDEVIARYDARRRAGAHQL